MSDRLEIPLPVPDRLLGPLLEAAGETLRALAATEVPLALRHLRGLDRRGLSRGPALRQLRSAVESDEWFRAGVIERFLARAQVGAVLDRWEAEVAVDAAEDAARRDDLGLLASALWAARPEGWAFGLGVVVAVDAALRQSAQEQTRAQERGRRVEDADDARRRADADRMTAEATVARLERELRDERDARRASEDETARQAAAAARRANGLAARLEQARAAEDDARAHAVREAGRLRDLEAELDRLRSAPTDAAEPGAAAVPAAGVELPERAGVARPGRGLTVRLAELLDGLVTVDGPARARPTPPADAPAAPEVIDVIAMRDVIEVIASSPGAVLVVDGHDLTRGTGSAAADVADVADVAYRRARLARDLAGLHDRLGCEIVVVFDGAGGVGLPTLRRPGLRVLFSEGDEDTGDLVVRVVAQLVEQVPVVVVSSDARVCEQAEAEGAAVSSSAALRAALV